MIVQRYLNIYFKEGLIFETMKLRLEKGSIKVRLAAEEIIQLRAENCILEQLYFSKDNKFSFSVEIKSDAEKLDVNLGVNHLEIIVPKSLADKWMSSNQVGIKEIVELNHNETMEIVVEEDLPPRKMKQESRK